MTRSGEIVSANEPVAPTAANVPALIPWREQAIREILSESQQANGWSWAVWQNDYEFSSRHSDKLLASIWDAYRARWISEY